MTRRRGKARVRFTATIKATDQAQGPFIAMARDLLLTVKVVIDPGDRRVSGVIDLLTTLIGAAIQMAKEATDPRVLSAAAMAHTEVGALDPLQKVK